jgi:hypothetical protein
MTAPSLRRHAFKTSRLADVEALDLESENVSFGNVSPRAHTTLHFLDSDLLVRDRLNEKLTSHRTRLAHIVERVHRLAECHASDDRVGQDIDFDIAAWPRHLAAHDRRVVSALFRRDGEVNAMGEVVAVIEWRGYRNSECPVITTSTQVP